MELDEDSNGNVFVKSIDKGGRAEKSGKIFVGDIVAMAGSTFGGTTSMERCVALIDTSRKTKCGHVGEWA
jgi:C-terminal processing protease CtpA/Prc